MHHIFKIWFVDELIDQTQLVVKKTNILDVPHEEGLSSSYP